MFDVSLGTVLLRTIQIHLPSQGKMSLSPTASCNTPTVFVSGLPREGAQALGGGYANSGDLLISLSTVRSPLHKQVLV